MIKQLYFRLKRRFKRRKNRISLNKTVIGGLSVKKVTKILERLVFLQAILVIKKAYPNQKGTYNDPFTTR